MIASLIFAAAMSIGQMDCNGHIYYEKQVWPVQYNDSSNLLTFRPNTVLPEVASTPNGMPCKLIYWIPSEDGTNLMQVDVIGRVYHGEEDFFSYIWLSPNINPHYGGWYTPKSLPEPDPNVEP